MHSNKSKQLPEITTLLGKGSRFNGEMSFEGAVRIDGQYTGKINSQNAVLVVGKSGSMEGDVFVKELIVQGRFSGQATVSELTQITEKANFAGELQTKTLIIEAGAFFNASCKMSSSKIKNSEKK